MSVYEGTLLMLQKLKKYIDGEIEKNTSYILSNEKKDGQDLGGLKKETDDQIKKLSDQVKADTDNITELNKQFKEVIGRIEVLEGKKTS